MVEQLINYPKGTLSFLQQVLFCYSARQGAFIVNHVCYVDPSIEKIDCVFKGYLRKNGIKDEFSEYYDTIIFNSEVSLNLSSIVDEHIKSVYFIKDVKGLNVDCDTKKAKHIHFHVPYIEDSKILRFCQENNLNFEVEFGYPAAWMSIKEKDKDGR